jgi:hypothetical protein
VPSSLRRLLRGRSTAQQAAQLAAARESAQKFRAERDMLRLRMKDVRTSERSVVAELHRLREITFGRPDREAPGAQPGYLFVISCGRTGSTLVQGVLNSTPGVLIRGENGGVMTDLLRLHRTAGHHRERLALEDKLLKSTHPWWGIDGYPDDLALREFRHLATDLLLRPDPGVHTVGFKEVKWAEGQVADYVDFLREVFPGARFVLSSRRLADVAASGWWARRSDAMERLTALDAELRKTVDGLGTAGFEVSYDDVVGNVDGWRPMFDWLGWTFRRPVIEAVTARPHSYIHERPPRPTTVRRHPFGGTEIPKTSGDTKSDDIK